MENRQKMRLEEIRILQQKVFQLVEHEPVFDSLDNWRINLLNFLYIFDKAFSHCFPDSIKQEERTMDMKEQIRGEIQANLERLALGCRDLASLLRRLQIPVEGGVFPSPQQVTFFTL